MMVTYKISLNFRQWKKLQWKMKCLVFLRHSVTTWWYFSTCDLLRNCPYSRETCLSLHFIYFLLDTGQYVWNEQFQFHILPCSSRVVELCDCLWRERCLKEREFTLRLDARLAHVSRVCVCVNVKAWDVHACLSLSSCSVNIRWNVWPTRCLDDIGYCSLMFFLYHSLLFCTDVDWCM